MPLSQGSRVTAAKSIDSVRPLTALVPKGERTPGEKAAGCEKGELVRGNVQ